MGNSQSSPFKNETRRSNRLSKPLTKKSVALSSPQLPQSPLGQSELSGGLVGWHNPWTDSIVSRDVRNSYPRPREIPPPLFEVDEPVRETWGANETHRSYPSSRSLPPSPGSLSASPSVRRASYQSGPAGSSSQSSFVPETPRRANSIQTPLSRHGSVTYGSSIENATSSNTHFLVGNQRFSLTRRRSLLTRPGVATRRTTGTIRRIPSPIGEPESPGDDRFDPHAVHWPLPPRQRPTRSIAPPARPSSPADARYTQLGALKLGSLRVVNGSASPCPSDRISLVGACPTGPGLGLENVGSACPSGPMLEIPAVVDIKNPDDVPGSPFSFEKSPILAVHTEPRAVFFGDVEDEGIGMCDESSVGVGIDRSTSRSINKSDSGYSSATSAGSIPGSRARVSLDSEASSFCTVDNGRNPWLSDDRLGGRPRRSTLCAPKCSDYSGSVETASVTCVREPMFMTEGFSRADPARRSGTSMDLETASIGQRLAGLDAELRRHRSASERRVSGVKSEFPLHRSRSRSRPNGRVWYQVPGIEAPPLPTILSPDHSHGETETGDAFFPPETRRGRSRSRSHDTRRRKLTKAQPLFI
ncbi:hypothetical protein N7492_004889 [Penicillium capsulatum]|uniref:Uncharacterized protein n=1 Tax=Penicillium capsulatum TaxID=69766 RepID=A0A9W9I8S6_9EURO|nr:hypothetical protein N7492_004889 [Penicillium capsulatum]KAJ6136003.1 hypothetical protein N7512_001163 [Penicillium capsulatum]